MPLKRTSYVGKSMRYLSVRNWLLSFVPKNPFADLTGANPTSIINVVIFARILVMAALKLLKDDALKGERVCYRMPAKLGDEAGASGDATYALLTAYWRRWRKWLLAQSAGHH